MARSAAREQSYVEALMVLGPAPSPGYQARRPFDNSFESIQERTEYYTQHYRYRKRVMEYFKKHVFQGGISQPRNTANWVQDFYVWQIEQEGE